MRKNQLYQFREKDKRRKAIFMFAEENFKLKFSKKKLKPTLNK